MKSDDIDELADDFTPGSPPAEPKVKDRSGLYLAVILVVVAAVYFFTR